MEEFSDLDEETGINIANMNEIDFTSENIITPLKEDENTNDNINVVNININLKQKFAEELEPYLNRPPIYNENDTNNNNFKKNSDFFKAKRLKNFFDVSKKYKQSLRKESYNENKQKNNNNNNNIEIVINNKENINNNNNILNVKNNDNDNDNNSNNIFASNFFKFSIIINSK